MITLYFGSPGAGKSTICARMASKYHSKNIFSKYYKYRHCISNLPLDIKNVGFDDMFDLGKRYAYPRKTLVLIDEASVLFNNRDFRSFDKSQIEYFKLHRHYENDIVLFSQSWEDVDVTIRRLTTELWHIRKLGPFTVARKVHKFCDTDEVTKQIIDGYEFEPLWKILLFQPVVKVFLRRPYYKYFDSYSVNENLPIKRIS